MTTTSASDDTTFEVITKTTAITFQLIQNNIEQHTPTNVMVLSLVYLLAVVNIIHCRLYDPSSWRHDGPSYDFGGMIPDASIGQDSNLQRSMDSGCVPDPCSPPVIEQPPIDDKSRVRHESYVKLLPSNPVRDEPRKIFVHTGLDKPLIRESEWKETHRFLSNDITPVKTKSRRVGIRNKMRRDKVFDAVKERPVSIHRQARRKRPLHKHRDPVHVVRYQAPVAEPLGCPECLAYGYDSIDVSNEADPGLSNGMYIPIRDLGNFLPINEPRIGYQGIVTLELSELINNIIP